MNALPRPVERRVLLRVLACATAPADPGEIHELAAADVVLDRRYVRLEALHAESFGLGEGDCGGTTCTPMHVTKAVWGGRSPDVLVAHDAVTASLTFTRALTCGLPWISIHKVARRVWPGQDSYALMALARWRAWAGPHGPFSFRLPSGAERDAELAAGLIAELMQDPGLFDVADGILLENAERQEGGGAVATRIRARDAVDAATTISDLPARPLKEPPYPFDDPREWSGIGIEDLWHHARFSEDPLTLEAANAELRSRLGLSD